MEIVIPAPVIVLWVVIGLDVVAVASVVLKKGAPEALVDGTYGAPSLRRGAR